MTAKWDYKVIPLHKTDYGEFQKDLLQAGEDGWELVTIIESPSLRRSLGTGSDYFAIFKKPRV